MFFSKCVLKDFNNFFGNKSPKTHNPLRSNKTNKRNQKIYKKNSKSIDHSSDTQSLQNSLSRIQKSFVLIQAADVATLNELIDDRVDVGIYGQSKSIPGSIDKSHKYYFIGENQNIRGIGEYSALNLEHILILQEKPLNFVSSMFKSPQKFSIMFETVQQIQIFIKKWEQNIMREGDQFLIRNISKFTIKISRIDGKYWVTVNQLILDMSSCFPWEKIGKNVQKVQDLEMISYYLRCFYTHQFILLIRKKINQTSQQSLNQNSPNNCYSETVCKTPDRIPIRNIQPLRV